MRTARADLAAGIIAVVVVWAIAIVPAYMFFEWPRQIDTLSLVGVVRIAAVLGLVAGIARFPQPAVRLLLVIATVWVVCCPLTAWPAILHAWLVGAPACRGACVVCVSLLGMGRTGAPGWLDLVVLVAGLLLAVWRRPQRQAGDSAGSRRMLLVRYGALLCLVGGPVAGLAGWLLLAPGDIYGGPLGLGVLIGLFGLLTFTGHAAFDGLLRRADVASAMAPVYAAVVILAPVAFAARSGTLRLLP